MQIEEDLGYTISAETLPSFNSVKHYITYIEQVEAFKRENNKNPIAWLQTDSSIDWKGMGKRQ